MLLVAAVVWLAACGPTLYTMQISGARRAVEQAREADAARYAPYEYYLAAEHLVKAREEAAEASYEDAIRYAERAEELGARAREIARGRMRGAEP